MKNRIYTITAFLLLSSCVTEKTTDQLDSDLTKVSRQESADISTKETKTILERSNLSQEVKSGIISMQNGDYNEAAKLFNTALLDNPSDSYIHFLNGLNYLHKAAAGDAGARDLALVGFRYAIVYDPSNVLARKRLGYMHYQAKEFDKAQQQFAEVLLLQEPDVKILYALAAASYYNHDLKTAYAVITKAVNLAPNNKFVLKAAAMIAAALNQPLEMQNYRKEYLKKTKKNDKHLDQRLRQWMGVYNNPNIVLTSADGGDGGNNQDGGGDQGGANNQDDGGNQGGGNNQDDGGDQGDDNNENDGGDQGGGNNQNNGGMDEPAADATSTAMARKLPPFDPKNPDTFVIDCAIMRVSEQGGTSKGKNILDTMSLMLNPGSFSREKTWNTPGDRSTVKKLTQSLAITGTAYSLNIFNVIDNRVEIVSRPTLLAAIGKTSEFFAGTDLIANVSSTMSGNSIEKLPVGYRLMVTPIGSRKDKDGVLKVQFDVRVEGNTIGQLLPFAGSASTASTDYSKINHSFVITTVELAFGETTILAGIYDREDNSTKSYTPGLGQIPGLGLFFSNESTDSIRKSVVYMMTLRQTDKMQEDANSLGNGKHMSTEVRDLQLKNASWFSTVPNSALIMRGLSKINREFRTGDMPSIYWWHSDLEEKDNNDLNNELNEAVKMMST